MGIDREDGIVNQKRYQEALQKFEDFLGRQKKIQLYDVGIPKRVLTVESEIEKYGRESLFSACGSAFIEGYPVIVKTLRCLSEHDVHTKLQLLVLDTNQALKSYRGFGPASAEVVGILKEMFASEING